LLNFAGATCHARRSAETFDAVNTSEGLAIVLCDVSGKGVSAAILASILQGMVYSHLIAGMPLAEIMAAVNRFSRTSTSAKNTRP
jgi:serine phosphatase RsbU (regulator of sigma subunit)